jgi:hypothetical protein
MKRVQRAGSYTGAQDGIFSPVGQNPQGNQARRLASQGMPPQQLEQLMMGRPPLAVDRDALVEFLKRATR